MISVNKSVNNPQKTRLNTVLEPSLLALTSASSYNIIISVVLLCVTRTLFLERCALHCSECCTVSLPSLLRSVQQRTRRKNVQHIYIYRYRYCTSTVNRIRISVEYLHKYIL